MSLATWPQFVTGHVAHVSLTVITCLTPHTVNVLSVLFLFCHCWLTRMAPQHGADGTGITTHGCILYHRITARVYILAGGVAGARAAPALTQC